MSIHKNKKKSSPGIWAGCSQFKGEVYESQTDEIEISINPGPAGIYYRLTLIAAILNMLCSAVYPLGVA